MYTSHKVPKFLLGLVTRTRINVFDCGAYRNDSVLMVCGLLCCGGPYELPKVVLYFTQIIMAEAAGVASNPNTVQCAQAVHEASGNGCH